MAAQRKWWAVARPFVRGMVTDKPPWAIRDQESIFAQDGIAPAGVFDKRYGWEYDGSVQDVAANLIGVWRAKFSLANVRRTLTSTADAIYIHNAAAAGTSLPLPFSQSMTGYKAIPRCMYRDMLVFASQAGTSLPLLFYGGATTTGAIEPGATFNADKATISSAAAGTLQIGQFGMLSQDIAVTNSLIHPLRVLEIGATVVTLEGLKAGSTTLVYIFLGGTNTLKLSPLAWSVPCVSVYDAGTASSNAGAFSVTGTGTKWSTGAWGAVVAYRDAVLIYQASSSKYSPGFVGAVTNDTTLTAAIATATENKYDILRPMVGVDAAAHKGSLFSAGSVPYPNRVWISPPDWNPGLPPGATPPVAIDDTQDNASRDYFVLDHLDIPATTDGDPNMALISTPGPLLAPKKQALYRIDGTYPNFDVGLVDDGAGCLDVRSAISVDNRAIWAGENGVFTFDGRRAIDLTEGRISKEWRALVNEWDTSSYVSCGISDRFLFVGGLFGATKRLYCYDMVDGTWISRFSNITPRAMFTARIADEIEALFVVDDDRQGRVLDIAPCVTGKKVTARDAQTKAAADALDDAGTGPVQKAWTGSIPANDDTDREGRLLKVAASTNLHDTGTAGASTLTVTTTHSGKVDSTTEETFAAGTISSDSTDLIDRQMMRVGVKGRRHGVKVEAGLVASTVKKSEIHEIAVETRDFRAGR